MPIDYSKWDKIEISDDSDVEVHPNVDKQSFIRWKQRDIHEKRMQRNIEIKSILIQLTMYAKLNERVDYLLEKLTSTELLDSEKVMSKLNSEFDPQEKFDYDKLIKDKGLTLRKGLKDLKFDREEIENTPCYNEMIEDLFVQIKDDHPETKTDGDKLIEYLKEHRNRIDDVLSKQTIKLDDLLYQKAQLIVSDDLHTGFDRSFLNKDKPEEKEEKQDKPKASEAKKTTVTTTETINLPKPVEENTDKEILDELEILPATKEFAKIPSDNLSKAAEFLIKHPSICTEQQKDALIMTAFDLQLKNKSDEAKHIVHQSLLLQYVGQLSGNGKAAPANVINAIKLFFSKIAAESSPAKHAFLEDVNQTFNHIKGRCEIIKEEQRQNAANKEGTGEEEEEEALIQLKALDDNTELLVNIPQEGTKEYEIFTTKLPIEFQNAIKTESIDEVNKEFAKLKIEDAERILEIFNECGVIGISGYIEDEKEFEELKKEYAHETANQEEDQSASVEDTVD